MREFDQFAEALDEPAERRRLLGGKCRHKFEVGESQRYCGRAQEVHRSGQSRSGHCGRLAPRHQICQRQSSEKGADEVTLGAEEERARRTFIDSTHVEDHRWERPQDADWHVFCFAIYQGTDGTRVGSVV